MFQLKYKHQDFKDLFEKTSAQDVNLVNPHINKMEYFRKNPGKLNWLYLSKNPSNCALKIIECNMSRIDLYGIIDNPSHNIGPILKEVSYRFSFWEWNALSMSNNPVILSFLSKHPKNIDWTRLHWNVNDDAIRIFENNLDRVQWHNLSPNYNPLAIHLLEKNLHRIGINWSDLSGNPNAIHLLEKNLDKINWDILSSNHNAIHLLEQNMDKINWCNLSLNHNAIHLLEKNISRHDIDFSELVFNTNPKALDLIEKHIDRVPKDIDLHRLASRHIHSEFYNSYYGKDYNCIPMIRKMYEHGKISLKDLKDIVPNINPESIYELDYQAMSKDRTKIIFEELMSKALHPTRISKWLDYHIEQGMDISTFDF
jgi:hypothetical protein